MTVPYRMARRSVLEAPAAVPLLATPVARPSAGTVRVAGPSTNQPHVALPADPGPPPLSHYTLIGVL